MALKLNGTNSVAAPAYAGADADTGLQCGTDEVNLVTGGTARLKIDSSGQVGIGTTTVNNLNKLHLRAASASLPSTSNQSVLLVENSNNTWVTIGSPASNYAGILFADPDDADVGQVRYNHNGNSLEFITNAQERLRIDSSGNVGIGTSSPDERLDVAGNIVATDTSPYIKIQASSTGVPNLFFNQDTTRRAFLRYQNSGQFDIINEYGDVTIWTGTSGSETQKVTVTPSGNVGIGTSSPGTTLDVKAASATTYVAQFADSATTKPAKIYVDANGVGFVRGSFADGIEFASNTARIYANGSERLRIDSSGRVGVGTTGPLTPLHIASSGNTPGLFDCTGGTQSYLYLRNTGGGAYVSSQSNDLAFHTSASATERARIDSSGRLLVGTSSWGSTSRAVFSGNSTDNLETYVNFNRGTAATAANSAIAFLNFTNGASTESCAYISCYTDGACGSGDSPGRLMFSTAADGSGSPTERMRIDSSGVVSINQTSASNIFRVQSSGPNESNMLFQNSNSGTGPGNGLYVGISGSAIGYLWNYESQPLVFGTSGVERMRMSAGGTLIIGSTDASLSATGNTFTAAGSADHTRDGGNVVYINRLTNDGNLIQFYGDTNFEGSISISGSTISYNGGHLARWSQLPSGAERTEILRGSVLSNLDEMCEWGEEDNEQLNRMKISDVEGDVNVAGVFQAWDDDDDTYTNDFYCAMTGDFVIRIAQGTTVARGDLLMSAGDGTAKPQDDDIVRSKTIAKVTSTTVSTTYSDGSYCVPCVLMAC